MEQNYGRRPLEADEVVVHVPKGTGKNVKIEEVDSAKAANEITVQISKKRKPSAVPVLGVIVK
jgi:hypothetical protein